MPYSLPSAWVTPCVAEAVAQLPEVRGFQCHQPEALVGRRRPAGIRGFVWTCGMSSARSALGGEIPALDLQRLVALPSPPST